MEQEKYWFKSTQFQIEPDEDEETNPGCFGKALAHWLANELKKYKYETEVIPEDWGWCVMCLREDFLLWVGCGNMMSEEIRESTLDQPPSHENIIWHVFVEVEIPFFMVKSIFKKWLGMLDLNNPKLLLKTALNEILVSNENLQFCEEP